MSPRFDKPEVVRGGILDWPMMQRWNPDYLSGVHGAKRVRAVRDGRPAYAERADSYTVGPTTGWSGSGEKTSWEASVGEARMDFVRTDRRNEHPLLKDLRFPNPWFDHASIRRYIPFVGSTGTGTLPHTHGQAFNLLCTGVKRWYLFDADEQRSPAGARLARRFDNEFGRGSKVADWLRSGYAELEQAGDILIHQFEQHAGDVVVIPSNYAHAVINIGSVIGLVVEVGELPS